MAAKEGTLVSSPISGGRIPSLDGLRALSISLVLLAHVCRTQDFSQHGFWFYITGNIGNLGVRVFFVISAFLITTLLMEENAKTGRISLKNFYFRRVLRIFPAAYSFVGIVGIACFAGLLQATKADFVAACTYTMNYLKPQGWNLGHLWSLAVEEQFYIMWPLALCLSGKRRAMMIAGFMFLLGPCARFAFSLSGGTNIWVGDESFLSNADALAIGCILAGMWIRLGTSQAYLRLQRSWLFLAVPIVIGICGVLAPFDAKGLRISLLNVCIALCIDWCVRRHDTIVGLILKWRPLAFVGVLSYSLYLWQQPFLNRNALHPLPFPINLLLPLVFALGSFYLVERQFFKLRKYFISTGPAIEVPARRPKAPAREREELVGSAK